MKNIKNTTKYFKTLGIILIAIISVAILPAVSLADENYSFGDTGSGYYPSYDVNSSDYSTYDINSSDSYPTYSINNSNYPTYDVNGATGINPTYDINGNDYPTYDIAGSNYPTYDVAGSDYPTSAVSSGVSFTPSYSNMGSAGFYEPTMYYGSQTSTVGSGISFTPASATMGAAPLYVPTTYYTQPTSVVSSGVSFTPLNSTYYTYSQPVVQTMPNQVLAYTDTNPNVSSVYLSDVPYTGFTDELPMIIFISALVLWSGILAYVFLKRKIDGQKVFAKISKNEISGKDSDESTTSEFMDQVSADRSDINKVEEYARTNKVLLSSDASNKIVMLSRLGKINASDFIRSIATGEWVAVGDEQVK